MIADNGSWIPNQQQEEIFNPFVSGDKSRNDKNGSGLGLAITKKIVEKHGGKISIEKMDDDYTKAFAITLNRIEYKL
jgi:signal transduction histidine kinase